MAKMFYTLEEAALKLGMSQEELKEMASAGQLQQFRDRDKVMFKRQQIDDLAQEQDADLDESLRTDVDGLLSEPMDATIPLADDEEMSESGSPVPSEDDMIDLITGPELQPLDIPDSDQTPVDPIDGAGESGSAALQAMSEPGQDDTGDLSGITQITDATTGLDDSGDLPDDENEIDEIDEIDDEELVLEQVGSGSGLLDLTRESDDTSLGTELLDEIYPDPGDAPPQETMTEPETVNTGSDASGTLDTMEAIEAAITSSSIFDGSGELDISTSGLENLQDSGEPSSVVPPSMTIPTGETVEALAFDYPGNGLGVGMLMVAISSLFLALTVMIFALNEVPSTTTQSLSINLPAYCSGLLGLGIVLGLVGMFFGKAQKR